MRLLAINQQATRPPKNDTTPVARHCSPDGPGQIAPMKPHTAPGKTARDLERSPARGLAARAAGDRATGGGHPFIGHPFIGHPRIGDARIPFVGDACISDTCTEDAS